MPPPRLGQTPYGTLDLELFSEDDPFGWPISEIEEEYELKPGLENIAAQILAQLVELGRGKPAHHIYGHRRRDLEDNPYWPSDLAAKAGQLEHERFVIFLPLALSRTQDDMGRVSWTFFGGSEQGPERAFWKSFYSAPGQPLPRQESLGFVTRLLQTVYAEKLKAYQKESPKLSVDQRVAMLHGIRSAYEQIAVSQALAGDLSQAAGKIATAHQVLYDDVTRNEFTSIGLVREIKEVAELAQSIKQFNTQLQER